MAHLPTFSINILYMDGVGNIAHGFVPLIWLDVFTEKKPCPMRWGKPLQNSSDIY